jgi:hypothetical protein
MACRRSTVRARLAPSQKRHWNPRQRRGFLGFRTCRRLRECCWVRCVRGTRATASAFVQRHPRGYAPIHHRLAVRRHPQILNRFRELVTSSSYGRRRPGTENGRPLMRSRKTGNHRRQEVGLGPQRRRSRPQAGRPSGELRRKPTGKSARGLGARLRGHRRLVRRLLFGLIDEVLPRPLDRRVTAIEQQLTIDKRDFLIALVVRKD